MIDLNKKIFVHNKIFMPNEYNLAVQTIFSGDDVVVLGMNGFSNIKYDEWGVKPGAYEAACENLLIYIITNTQEEFQGIKICLANGASDLGVDASSYNVSKKLNLPLLGHSCPHFLFYVKDSGFPIYVAENQAQYSSSFTTSLDILITANGGQITFEHDIDTAFNKGKDVIPLKVLQAISSTGGPPAFDAEGKVVDAVSAFEQRVHMVALHLGLHGTDQWQVLKDFSKNQIISICRHKVSPQRAFNGR